jgi:hypothetical protein
MAVAGICGNSSWKGQKNMHIGIDFDNTIICYDQVFNRVGATLGLIPGNLENGKNNVRNYLRKRGQEDDWTRLQGYVYGRKLDQASLFDGVKPFLDYCRDHQVPCSIISHKTRFPYLGKPYDLRRAALTWIRDQGLTLPVFFESTQAKKLHRICHEQCTLFIDDLPEFLSLPGFPDRLVRVLFDPSGQQQAAAGAIQVRSWNEILLMAKKKG